MARRPILYGPDDQPINLEALKVEAAGPTLTAVRQVIPEHPSWGLSPEGLAAILRDSEGHDPSRFYSLLEDVQEREWHYRSVLFQRRSASAQLPISVDPASDDKAHVEHADLIRQIVMRPEFTLTRFDLSDALDKGMAFNELLWDTSEGQWMPTGIEHRYPQWFRYDRVDLKTPLLLDETGQAQPLQPWKWIVHRARLTAGIPIRDGLGRAAVWAWMFKNFDIKAWLVFLDKFGQPLRLGRYPAAATPAERATLLLALRNLGSDAAAIIPEGMTIEFMKGEGAGGGGGDAFKAQATYFDEQLSKLVVGQTATTDKGGGSFALAKVHEGVLDAVALYDATVLAATLNRDLVRPVIDLNFGKQRAYPTIKIGLGDQQNVELILTNAWEAVDRGLPIEASQIYPLLNMTEPAKGKNVVLLRPLSRSMPGEQPGGSPVPPGKDRAEPPGGNRRPTQEESAAETPTGEAERDAVQIAAEEAADPALLAELREKIEDALEQSTSFEEFQARLEGLVRGPVDEKMVNKLASYLFNARLAGELGAPLSKTD